MKRENQMIKRIIGAAAVLAVSCSIFACAGKKSGKSSPKDRVMDIPAAYKDFLDYTFDGNYTISLSEEGVINEGTDREQAYRYYDVSYVRKDGTKRSAIFTSKEFTDSERKMYESEQRMNNEEMNAFCHCEIREAFEKEFVENILRGYLDVEYKEDGMSCENEDYNCFIGVVSNIGLFSMESEFYEKSCRIVDSHIAPGTGYKLSEAGLKTAANDREFYFIMRLTIKNGADVQPYIEKMNSIISDYFAYVGNPMNCSFVIKETSDGTVETTKTIFDKNFLMGQEIDIEEKRKENEKFKIANEIIRICLEE